MEGFHSYCVTCDFVPDEEQLKASCFELRVGDVIEVKQSAIKGTIESLANEWIYGMNKRSNETGYFLGNYVEHKPSTSYLRPTPRPRPRARPPTAQQNDSGYGSPYSKCSNLMHLC